MAAFLRAMLTDITSMVSGIGVHRYRGGGGVALFNRWVFCWWFVSLLLQFLGLLGRSVSRLLGGSIALCFLSDVVILAVRA
jgi:hypothetical protein